VTIDVLGCSSCGKHVNALGNCACAVAFLVAGIHRLRHVSTIVHKEDIWFMATLLTAQILRKAVCCALGFVLRNMVFVPSQLG
jgi:hypothetical protein